MARVGVVGRGPVLELPGLRLGGCTCRSAIAPRPHTTTAWRAHTVVCYRDFQW